MSLNVPTWQEIPEIEMRLVKSRWERQERRIREIVKQEVAKALSTSTSSGSETDTSAKVRRIKE